MADEVDAANEEEQISIAASLTKRVTYQGLSAVECEECGDIIPQARRTSVPGVKTCVICQQVREREAKLLRAS